MTKELAATPGSAHKSYPVASAKEVMAAVIAHDLRDEDWVEVGANLPVPRAGALLAHLTHGPNMTVMLAMTKAYLRDEPILEEYEYITDVGAMRWAEAYYPHDQLLNSQRRRANGVFFCGGVQIDRFGNSNLIGVGSDYKRLKFRGPGPIGTTNASAQSGRWHLVTTSHDPRVLVDQVDYISAVGYGRGEPNHRENVGLKNPGPTYIITPLCVFDFHPTEHHARLASIHPGVTLDEVVNRTGFTIDISESTIETVGPTPHELEILRTRIDTRGSLK
jgi:glutaconate CoA-transferase subunit B